MWVSGLLDGGARPDSYALETDWLAGAAGFEPLHFGIRSLLSAHYWSRRLGALGHTVRLLPPSYVKAYLKRNKNDANAAAICEAVTRPSMRAIHELDQCSRKAMVTGVDFSRSWL